ncbi:hypothetical protein LJ721_004720 [Salmonella enterica]|nr:hypothetical protein [Salmonella enterica]
MQDKISVTLDLTRQQAEMLAQFIKRTTHNDCVDKAAPNEDAYVMMDGINEVMRALAEAGFNPR